MSRSKLILIATFVLVLSAGMVVGRLMATLPTMTVTHPTTRPSQQQPWWAAQLDLTTTQRSQIDAIWADTKPKVDETFDRRRQLERKREEAVEDLLGPQYPAYEKLFNDFYAQRTEIDKERQNLIHDAEDRTKALLSDAQLKQLEALGPHEFHIPRSGGSGGHRSNQTTTTMPAADGGDGIRPQ